MGWEKHGTVFRPPGDLPWMTSHAALPVPLRMSGDRYRVYCSGRDERQRSRIGYFEIGLAEPGRTLRVSRAPLLDVGALGAFDDSGVTTSCLVRSGEHLHLWAGHRVLDACLPAANVRGHKSLVR